MQEGVAVERAAASLVRLLGIEAFAALRRAHLVVVGVGGVGSWAAEALARSAVGRLTLIDADIVSEGNLNRQLQARMDNLGQSKVLALAERLALVAPGLEVEVVDDWLSAETIDRYLPKRPDAVLDATDDQQAKVALAAWARSAGVPLVMAGAAGGKRDATRLRVCDLAEAVHDPLLARVRYRLRSRYGFPRAPQPMGIAVVSSSEPRSWPSSGCSGRLNCHGFGALVTVTATMGLWLAQCALEAVVRSLR